MEAQSKKVLIVDSDNAFREAARTFIKTLGHQVFEATTALEAIDKAARILPDLILVDLRLSGLNSDDVTARLKANQSARNIPLVINTGWTTAGNAEQRINRTLIAAAAEILYSPVQFPTLRIALRDHFFV